jgi:hypothetical protein
VEAVGLVPTHAYAVTRVVEVMLLILSSMCG